MVVLLLLGVTKILPLYDGELTTNISGNFLGHYWFIRFKTRVLNINFVLNLLFINDPNFEPVSHTPLYHVPYIPIGTHSLYVSDIHSVSLPTYVGYHVS